MLLKLLRLKFGVVEVEVAVAVDSFVSEGRTFATRAGVLRGCRSSGGFRVGNHARTSKVDVLFSLKKTTTTINRSGIPCGSDPRIHSEKTCLLPQDYPDTIIRGSVESIEIHPDFLGHYHKALNSNLPPKPRQRLSL